MYFFIFSIQVGNDQLKGSLPNPVGNVTIFLSSNAACSVGAAGTFVSCVSLT